MVDKQSVNSAATHGDHVEQVSDALKREWLCDGRIVVYTLKDVRRESVDAWVNAFLEDIMKWPVDKPMLIMHDFTAPGAVASPYARARAQEIVEVRPEIKGRAAVVLSGSVFNNLIHLFLNKAGDSTPRTRRTFSSREKALAWLLSES